MSGPSILHAGVADPLWCKGARGSRDNPRRHWYVWNDTDERYAGVERQRSAADEMSHL